MSIFHYPKNTIDMPFHLIRTCAFLTLIDFHKMPQMEIWRGMLQRIEEDADEDGFEEL